LAYRSQASTAFSSDVVSSTCGSAVASAFSFAVRLGRLSIRLSGELRLYIRLRSEFSDGSRGRLGRRRGSEHSRGLSSVLRRRLKHWAYIIDTTFIVAVQRLKFTLAEASVTAPPWPQTPRLGSTEAVSVVLDTPDKVRAATDAFQDKILFLAFTSATVTPEGLGEAPPDSASD
jgi:hypothetical protein